MLNLGNLTIVVMKTVLMMFMAVVMSSMAALRAETVGARYIEVSGVSQVKVVPDKIHYMVSLKEYFIEEFEGKKPEEYRTQVPMAQIDSMFTCRLRGIGIADSCVRVVEVGDYGWRNEGKPFCISKCYDVTLNDFATIDSINAAIDRRAVEYMRVGQLECGSIDRYRHQCRIEALEAARDKACYMAQALGAQVGDVLSIEEPAGGGFMETTAASLQASNVASNTTGGYDNFRTITLQATVRVRFELK